MTQIVVWDELYHNTRGDGWVTSDYGIDIFLKEGMMIDVDECYQGWEDHVPEKYVLQAIPGSNMKLVVNPKSVNTQIHIKGMRSARRRKMRK